MSLTVKPLANIGAEISGLDINEPVSEALAKELKDLWYEYGVLLIRGQSITPENQIAFSRTFGPLEIHPLKAKTSEANPELFVLENGGDKDQYATAFYKGEKIVGRLDWHIDLHYTGKPN